VCGLIVRWAETLCVAIAVKLNAMSEFLIEDEWQMVTIASHWDCHPKDV
jgi:hypothetical protein